MTVRLEYFSLDKSMRCKNKMMYNQDRFIINLGRKPTIYGIIGFFIGLIGYGFIEHFLLLLALDQHKKGTGLIGAQIILLPYLGQLYADKIDYKF